MPRRIWAGAGVGAAVFSVHFAMTFLFVAPLNPVSLDHNNLVNHYMAPLFQQNWQLFAPNPVNEERGLLVRARVRRADGAITETAFHDFTSPLITDLHATRLFPPRKSRMVSNTMQLLGFRDPIADRLRRRIDDLRADELIDGAGAPGDDAAREPLPLSPSEQHVYRTAVEVLRSVATEAARERWGDGVVEIQVRIVVHQFPPFSRRGDDPGVGELVVQDVEWMRAAS